MRLGGHRHGNLHGSHARTHTTPSVKLDFYNGSRGKRREKENKVQDLFLNSLTKCYIYIYLYSLFFCIFWRSGNRVIYVLTARTRGFSLSLLYGRRVFYTGQHQMITTTKSLDTIGWTTTPSSCVCVCWKMPIFFSLLTGGVTNTWICELFWKGKNKPSLRDSLLLHVCVVVKLDKCVALNRK